jgi:hypothetical protein
VHAPLQAALLRLQRRRAIAISLSLVRGEAAAQASLTSRAVQLAECAGNKPGEFYHEHRPIGSVAQVVEMPSNTASLRIS